MKWIKILIQLVLAAAIIAGGMQLAKKITSGKKKPAKAKVIVSVPIVTAKEFQEQSIRFDVTGSGTVTTEEQVTLNPQVSGIITYLSKNMVDGGFVQKGEILFKIDPSEYYLRLNTAKTAVSIQKTQLLIEKEEGKIARQEWATYQKRAPKKKASPLTLRKPQLKLAEANLKSAQIQMKLANLNVRRTIIRAPFNARVQKKNISQGQYVTPGVTLAKLEGIDKAKLIIPIRQEDAIWIKIPQKDHKKPFADVTINGLSNGRKYQWLGKLVGTQSTIDPLNKMINLIIKIENPYDSKHPPLINGTFTTVNISGKTLNHIHKLPRELVQNNDLVYTVDQNHLKIKKVSVLRYKNGFAYINSGLAPKINILTSRVSPAVENMNVKVGKL